MSESPHTRRSRFADWDSKLAATTVVLTTVALSFIALQKLAAMCGFHGWLSWSWPICLDAVAYLATRTWLSKGPAWRFARTLAISAIALSLAGNGLVHGLEAYGGQPHWTIVVLVGAVPALMLALVAHMLVADRATAPVVKAVTRKPSKTKASVSVPAPAVIEPEAKPVPDSEVDTEPADSITAEMRQAGWAPNDYPNAKAAMRGYLDKVDPNIVGAQLERIVGQFFTISTNAGYGRKTVQEFKADMAAATSDKNGE